MNNFGQKLELRQGQQLLMTPQLQQAIKLLQMSHIELTNYVNTELESNPLLAIAPSVKSGAADPANEHASATSQNDTPQHETRDVADVDLHRDDMDRAARTFDTGMENVYADESRADAANDRRSADAATAPAPDPGLSWAGTGKGGSRSFESNEMGLEATLASEATLREHLLTQLGMTRTAPRLRLIVAYLVDQLDESGYLRTAPDETAARLGADPAAVRAAIDLLQGFDPAGVGAASLAECLALQLREKNRFDPAMRTLIDNLDLLAKRDLPKLMRLCAVDAEDLVEMVGEIRNLDPRPGAKFETEIVQTVIPDVYIRQNHEGGWSVDLNTDTLPRLLIDKSYNARIGAAGDRKIKSYITECQANASWLIKSLDQRARTILKVATEIVRQQDGFLAYGISALRPLNLRVVADAIGMHESTVSRVTSNKYISTSRGVFEMRFFFTAAINATDGGESHSAESIRHRIKLLISKENSHAILSDDKLVAILRGEGVDIARRTVAKYREAMNVPSSVQRRRLKNAAFVI